MVMRVAYLTHYGDLLGANRSLLELVKGLRASHGVEPVVLVPREGELTTTLRAAGIPVHVFGFEPWMTERWYGGRPHHRLMQWWREERLARDRARANASLLPAMTELLRNEGVQLVHANSALVGVAPLLADALKVPLVWHIREMPERHYGMHIDVGRRRYGAALERADRVVAISCAVEADVRRYAPRAKVQVIYNGVLTKARFGELADRLEARWECPQPFTFIMVGLIHPGKHQVEAVEALRLVRDRGIDARLVIVGTGREGPLRTRISELAMDAHVDLVGYQPDPFPLLLSAHALLMCSRHEAMGRATVEAMACGLPVIGHASGGTPELIEAGVAGLLYEGGAGPLADRMVQLAGDVAQARAMGLAAQASSAARFSVERSCAEVYSVYRAVLQDR